MAWPISLQIALKEWAVVCGALEAGRQIILLRKGGIHDAGGEFELEHNEFLLFPTYLHQSAAMLKPTEREQVTARSSEPEQVTISSAATVSQILKLRDRAQMDALDEHHIWSPALIDMRFNYRPENPLYLLLLRVYRLHSPATIANTPAYAGCKSWVPLERSIELGHPLPVLDDVKFESKKKAILEKLGA